MKKIKSIVTEYPDICCICGRIAEAEHHLIFGNLRQLADKDGITVGICHEHHTGPGRALVRIHDNPAAESLSKIAGQLAWGKTCGCRRHDGNGCTKRIHDPLR